MNIFFSGCSDLELLRNGYIPWNCQQPSFLLILVGQPQVRDPTSPVRVAPDASREQGAHRRCTDTHTHGCNGLGTGVREYVVETAVHQRLPPPDVCVTVPGRVGWYGRRACMFVSVSPCARRACATYESIVGPKGPGPGGDSEVSGNIDIKLRGDFTEERDDPIPRPGLAAIAD